MNNEETPTVARSIEEVYQVQRNVAIKELRASERRVEALQSRIDDLIDALGDVVLTCESMHHDRRDRHFSGSPCPVVARITAVLHAEVTL